MDSAFDMRPLNLEDYLDLWRRRKHQALVLGLLAAVLALLGVGLLPDVYRSEALILLEDSPMSASYVRPVLEGDLNRELSALTQQALSRTRLEEVIRAHQLYPLPRGVVSETVLADLRSRIQLEVVRGTAPGERGDPYALRVAFLAASPELAQKVASDLVSFFVQEDERLQKEGTQETLRLLAEQIQQATGAVAEQEKRLRDFKLHYSGQLPVQERLLVERLTSLQERLQARELALERARRTQAGEAALTGEPGELSSAAPSPQERRLETLQARLVELQSRYTPGHPDILKTEEEIAAVRRELEAGPSPMNEETTPGPSGRMRSRLPSPQSDVSRLEAEKQRLERDIRRYEADLKALPLRAYQLAELERDYGAAKERLGLLLERQRHAELASGVAHSLNGRRFLVRDYPSLPVRPHGPKRLRLSLAALAGAFLFGLAVTGGLELRDHSLKAERDVDFYLGVPNLATIPEWLTPAEQTRAARRRAFWIAAEAALSLGVLALFFWLYTRM